MNQAHTKRPPLLCNVIRHVAIEGLGYLEEALQAAGVDARYIEADSLASTDVELATGLIVLGGPISAYDTASHPFLAREIELIRRHLTERRPVLGICLGSQLLAAAAGARVYRGAQGKEIGWSDVQLTAAGRADPIWHEFPARFTTFHWHGDTFDLPADGEVLARTAAYVQAYRIAGHAYGIQFHPEVVPEQLAEWVAAYRQELEDEDLAPETVLAAPDGAVHRSRALQFAKNVVTWMFPVGASLTSTPGSP